MEVWKDIDGFRGLYQVSNKGSVRSYKTNKWKTLKPLTGKSDYLHVMLYIDGKSHIKSIHRLVLSAFAGLHKNLVCNHINEDKRDNRVENLEWVTQKENCNHGTGIEKQSITNSFRLRKYRYFKLFPDENIACVYEAQYFMLKDGFQAKGVKKSIDKNCQYKGFYWKRELVNK